MSDPRATDAGSEAAANITCRQPLPFALALMHDGTGVAMLGADFDREGFMSVQPAPSAYSVRRPAPREKPARRDLMPLREMELAPLTEDDEVFVALATFDLLQRLEHEPL
jgi:hypothetical protein